MLDEHTVEILHAPLDGDRARIELARVGECRKGRLEKIFPHEDLRAYPPIAIGEREPHSEQALRHAPSRARIAADTIKSVIGDDNWAQLLPFEGVHPGA